MNYLKKALKMSAALLLALVIGVSSSGTAVQAATANISTFQYGGSTKVKYKMYKGAKTKKATVTASSIKSYTNPYTGITTVSGELTVTMPKMSKSDVIKIANEAKKLNNTSGINFYHSSWLPVIIDENGNSLLSPTSFYYCSELYSKYDTTDKHKKLTAYSGNTKYSYPWYKTTKVIFNISYSPYYTGSIIVGIAGLKNGSVKKVTSKVKKYYNGTVSYLDAGYGSAKKGFIGGLVIK
ncbi:MAG: hypothetical protein K6B41_00610 [Butyrivibrio sp.]|nr:hypothetical protein [Butyrivibrio sp.]